MSINKGEFYGKRFVISTRSVDVSDPCENWVPTPCPKRITLESFDKIKLPSNRVKYTYLSLDILYLPNQISRFQMRSILFVRATHFNVHIFIHYFM